MDTTSPPVSPRKKRTNAVLGITIFVLLAGIAVGMYLLNFPVNIFPRAADDTFTRCGPSGQCNAYGWTANVGYKKVPDNCYVALYKCRVSQWDKALAVGCQKNTSNPSKNTAYYAEIHKKTASNPNPSIWDKVVSGTDDKGNLKPFYPPQECGIWQIDVGPPCNFSFHSYGNRRANICDAPQQFHNVCDGVACKRVPGAGSNECANAGTSPAPQCSHKKCENNKCVVVPGGNVNNKCSTDADCQGTPTPTPSPTPSKTPTPTPPVVTGTPTPTPSICPVPGAVSNVNISCPTCGGE